MRKLFKSSSVFCFCVAWQLVRNVTTSPMYTTWSNSNLFTFYTLEYHVLFKLSSKKLNKIRRVKTIKWAVIYLKYNELMIPGLRDACAVRRVSAKMAIIKSKKVLIFLVIFLDFPGSSFFRGRVLVFPGSLVFSLRFSYTLFILTWPCGSNLIIGNML